MLEFIRKHRGFFSIIFVLSAVGMVVSMFANPRGTGSSLLGTGVIAKVDGEEIRTTELLQAFQQEYESARESMDQQMKQMGNNPELRQYMEAQLRQSVTPDRVLSELIRNKFTVVTADRLGIVAAPENLRDRIAEIPAFQKEGRFDPLLYKERVASPSQFEKRLADSGTIESLQSVFVAGLGTISPLEEKESKFLLEPRFFESLKLDPRQFSDPKGVSPDEVKSYLADPQTAAKLQAFYDRHKNRFQKGAEIHARHILFKGDDAGLKKAQGILAALRNGTLKFEAAAKENSLDKSNSDKGGDLGFFGKGLMDPAFEQAAFALAKEGDLSAPVRSSFGYHLIELIARKPAENRTLEQANSEIASEVLLGERRTAKAREWLSTWISSGRVPSEAELKSRGLSWKKLPAWTPADERLGEAGFVESFLGDLLKLNQEAPLLKRVLNEGESLVVVRYRSAATSAETPSALQRRYQKIGAGLEQFLRTRFEGLEKTKQIVRSEKALSTLRSRLGEGG